MSLTKKQVENSPDINTREPVSRQHEASYLGYYGYGDYWGGPYMWGPASYPGNLAIPPEIATQSTADRIRMASVDSHLRSSDAVTGYHIDAADGEIGHLNGFVMDDEAWAIRYIEVATRNWWPGKKVLVSPAWIERVSWEESKVYVAVTPGSHPERPGIRRVSADHSRVRESALLSLRPATLLAGGSRKPAFRFAGRPFNLV